MKKKSPTLLPYRNVYLGWELSREVDKYPEMNVSAAAVIGIRLELEKVKQERANGSS